MHDNYDLRQEQMNKSSLLSSKKFLATLLEIFTTHVVSSHYESYLSVALANFLILSLGARVGQWWKHSPPTIVARLQFSASKPYLYVGWVCCWFSSLLREVFLWLLWLSPLLKNQHFQIPIRSEMHRPVWMSSKELLSASWVNKFQFFLIFTMITCKETQYHQNYHFHTFFSMLNIFILGPSISFRFMCNIPFLKRYWEGLLCEQRFVSCIAVSIYEVVRIAYHSRSFSQGVNKPITWLTSDANDSVNAKSHTRG